MLLGLEVYAVAVAWAHHLTSVQQLAHVLLRHPMILAGESLGLLLGTRKHQVELRKKPHRGRGYQQDRRRAALRSSTALLHDAHQDACSIRGVRGSGEEASLEVVDAKR